MKKILITMITLFILALGLNNVNANDTYSYTAEKDNINSCDITKNVKEFRVLFLTPRKDLNCKTNTDKPVKLSKFYDYYLKGYMLLRNPNTKVKKALDKISDQKIDKIVLLIDKKALKYKKNIYSKFYNKTNYSKKTKMLGLYLWVRNWLLDLKYERQVIKEVNAIEKSKKEQKEKAKIEKTKSSSINDWLFTSEAKKKEADDYYKKVQYSDLKEEEFNIQQANANKLYYAMYKYIKPSIIDWAWIILNKVHKIEANNWDVYLRERVDLTIKDKNWKNVATQSNYAKILREFLLKNWHKEDTKVLVCWYKTPRADIEKIIWADKWNMVDNYYGFILYTDAIKGCNNNVKIKQVIGIEGYWFNGFLSKFSNLYTMRTSYKARFNRGSDYDTKPLRYKIHRIYKGEDQSETNGKYIDSLDLF